MLGGSTTNEIVDLLELLLLNAGFRPVFYQSDYGRYYEDAVVDPSAVSAFRPDIAYIHTSCINVQNFPPVHAEADEMRHHVELEVGRFQRMWQSLSDNVGCQVIQNNFEGPPVAILGNLDATSPGGKSRFLLELNLAFAKASTADARLLIHDIHGLSARHGLNHWFDWTRWFSYKILMKPEANLIMASSLAAMVGALYGKSRKCLVLDLDNTLWGGVIGDDGPEKIQIGRETPVAESFTVFQEYCLALKSRGILLAVCSKNDEQIARQGLLLSDSVLKFEDFSAFRANWQPKSENIASIAEELSIGLDSLVFVDDNPAERAIVMAQLPMVAVPDVGSEVSHFAKILDEGRFFESVGMSREDIDRVGQYAANRERKSVVAQFATYGEYLDSLEMTAEIDSFKPVYMERIAQLTNKTNQFNLTTRRFTMKEIEQLAHDPASICLYGRLSDKFGDNGLVSVLAGSRVGDDLHIDLWLMSCRVLKREMEHAMLDALVERAGARTIRKLIGRYIPSKRNHMVAEHYASLGFTFDSLNPDTGETRWSLEISGYIPRNTHIQAKETVHG